MHSNASPTPETIVSQNIIWTRFDMRLKGDPKPVYEWCADGEGIFVVRQEAEGYFLYEEGRMLKACGSEIHHALSLATEHLREHAPALYSQLPRKGNGAGETGGSQ